MRKASLLAAGLSLVLWSAGAPPLAAAPGVKGAEALELAPASFPAIAKVDPRFQSYNVEMAEVIGARFWAPYPKDPAAKVSQYQDREPLDLKGNRRLRKLARALGPAYMRVSGTWANSVYFQDDDGPPLKAAPPGFKGVLTRAQWAGVMDFAKAVDAKVVTSFAVSEGARNPDGGWNPDQARRLFDYTRAIGGSIYAIEAINEPNLVTISALPKGYGAADFGRDEAAFRAFLRQEAPGVKTVGPSATGDAGAFSMRKLPIPLSTEALMSASPAPKFDVFSYHFYTSISQRCLPKPMAPTADAALSEAWLGLVDRAQDVYRPLRDRFTPGAPIWITEIGEASCGGDPWAATFLDTFRYVDQMARLAKSGVAVQFHNTLAASDYALIDDKTWEPRPSYWAAVLWRRVMGETVLDAGPIRPGLHVYAHCLRDKPGGVGLVAINLTPSAASLKLPVSAERYTLTADALQSSAVKLNGRPVVMAGDDLPPLKPERASGGAVVLQPASITFLAMPVANNGACGHARS